MAKLSLSEIGTLPEYKELIKKRRRIAIPLSFLMLLAYYTFILLVAYAPDFLAAPLGSSVVTLGIALGLAVIILTFLVTIIYVWYANTHIEPVVSAIQRKAAGHE